MFKGKKALITGHTGFKGTWLYFMLEKLGSQVFGISLENKWSENERIDFSNKNNSIILDIRNKMKLFSVVNEINPDIVFHLAAQPLVIESYNNPIETFETNVIGTANLLEALRYCNKTKAIVMITTDKVYHNNEWAYPYREIDKLGGHDPYSASKACSELVIHSYKQSFFKDRGIGITSVRAGNVIGGGDFSENRIVPDIIRSIKNDKELILRSPNSVRPWQHVTDVLWAYILVCRDILLNGESKSQSYNIAPLDNSSIHTVEYVVQKFQEIIPQLSYKIENNSKNKVHEMKNLRLDSSLIQSELDWKPLYTTDEALLQTAREYQMWLNNENELERQINEFVDYYLENRGVL